MLQNSLPLQGYLIVQSVHYLFKNVLLLAVPYSVYCCHENFTHHNTKYDYLA